jgi:hypothetical protein
MTRTIFVQAQIILKKAPNLSVKKGMDATPVRASPTGT